MAEQDAAEPGIRSTSHLEPNQLNKLESSHFPGMFRFETTFKRFYSLKSTCVSKIQYFCFSSLELNHGKSVTLLHVFHSSLWM